MDKCSSPSNSPDENNNPLPETSDKMSSLPKINPPFSENPDEISAENASVCETSVNESSIVAETSRNDMPTFDSTEERSSFSQVLGLVTEGHQHIPPEISEASDSNFSFTEMQENNPIPETSDKMSSLPENNPPFSENPDEKAPSSHEISAENASVCETSMNESSIAAESSRDNIPTFDSTDERCSFSQVLGLVTEGHQNITSEISEASDSNFSFPEMQENNPSFDSQSSKKPMENNLGFLMRVKPASILKKAVSSLSDEKFNPGMIGMVEVGVLGFEITVHKTEGMEKEVFGFLSLRADCLDKFVCEKTFRRMVSLHGVKTILDGVDEEDDIVTVFHINGSNLLSFGFGTPVSEIDPGTPFALHIDLGYYPQYPKFPAVSYGFDVVIKSKDLRTMCEQAQARTVVKECNPVTVTMDISFQLEAESCNIITTAPKKQCVLIDWQYCWESIKKALSIVEDCQLCFVTKPNDRIMLRFQLRGLGDLVFLTRNALFLFASTLHFASVV